MRASWGTQRASIRMTSVILRMKVPGAGGRAKDGGEAGIRLLASRPESRRHFGDGAEPCLSPKAGTDLPGSLTSSPVAAPWRSRARRAAVAERGLCCSSDPSGYT
jgi:hypothetical protein